jgi:hypothetical protein
VAGSFPTFKLLISARRPNSGKQQSAAIAPSAPTVKAVPQTNQQQQMQQQQRPQPKQNPQQNIELPLDLQQRIQALSPQDQAALEQVAASFVKNDLPSLSADNPVSELDLENTITSKYNVSSEVADILVEVLKLYLGYSALITNQQNDQSQSVKSELAASPQQQQPNKQPQMDQTNSNVGNNNNNDLSKTSYAGYRHMNDCLRDQTKTHGLSNEKAVSVCAKLLQDHLRNKYQNNQQQQQSSDQQSASPKIASVSKEDRRAD